MAKKAKLVTFSFITRVVVDEDASDEQIVEIAKSKIQDKLDNNELMENLDDIKDDLEIPL